MRGFLTINDLESILLDENIGNLIGISDKIIWSLALYIGEGKLIILYEKGQGLNPESFNQLSKIDKITKNNLKNIAKSINQIISLTDFREQKHLEFFCYYFNIIEIINKEQKKHKDLLEVLKHNLNQIELLEEGDVISFERSFYSHHAILTDSARMIVTHKYGEPENPIGSFISSKSLLGLPTEKGTVTEDFIIEVAGYRKLNKSNDLYDSLFPPRPKEQILEEARKRLGEQGYSISKRNCQHLVSEVRNGTSYSPEVQGVVNGAYYTTIAFGVIASAALLFSSFRNKEKEKKKNQMKEY